MQFDELTVARFVLPETIETIGRFTITWNLFEHNYMKNKGSEKAISDIPFSPIDEGDRETFYDLIETFRRSVIEYYGANQQEFDDALIKMWFYHSGYGAHITEIKDFFNYENNDLKACLYAICRIRNNLLHGEKDVFSINYQAKMVDAASEVLAFMNRDEMVECLGKLV